MSENNNSLETNKGQEIPAGDLEAVKEQEVPVGDQKVEKEQEAPAGDQEAAKEPEAPVGNQESEKEQEAPVGDQKAGKEQEAPAGDQKAEKEQEAPAGDQEAKNERKTPVSHTVVGIRFRHCGKIYTFKVGDLEVVSGTRVVVESEMGLSLGFVARSKYIVEQKGEPFKKVLRIATEKDFETIEKNKSLEDEAKVFCIEKAREYKLEMKIVTTETTLDKKRFVFYFTSDGRIDFRDLVRDLAAKFKTRIEMRQIGVRDEVKMLGGIGCCGRQTCCSLFLTSFAPITIRMAKQQELSINQSKLSGICGRLMCCLGYEYKENGEGGRGRGRGRAKAKAGPKEKAVKVSEGLAQDVQAPAESLRRAAPDREKEKVDTVPGQDKPVEEKKHGRRRRRRRRGQGRISPDKGAPEKKTQEKPSQERQPQHKPSQAKPETENKPGNREQQPSEKKDKGRPFSKRRRFWKKKKTSHEKDSSK